MGDAFQPASHNKAAQSNFSHGGQKGLIHRAV